MAKSGTGSLFHRFWNQPKVVKKARNRKSEYVGGRARRGVTLKSFEFGAEALNLLEQNALMNRSTQKAWIEYCLKTCDGHRPGGDGHRP